MSLREKILQVDDLHKEVVFVKEWGLEVGVRSMSGLQRAEVLNIATADGKVIHERLHPEMLVRCLFDPETGEQLFSDEDKEGIMKKSASAIEFLVSTAMNVNGIGSKAIEDAEKNSDSDTQSEDSISS